MPEVGSEVELAELVVGEVVLVEPVELAELVVGEVVLDEPVEPVELVGSVLLLVASLPVLVSVPVEPCTAGLGHAERNRRRREVRCMERSCASGVELAMRTGTRTTRRIDD